MSYGVLENSFVRLRELMTGITVYIRPIHRHLYPIALWYSHDCCILFHILFSDWLHLFCRQEPLCVEAEYSGVRSSSS